MKILLVSSSIYPSAGGSSEITENLAKNFGRSEMTVLGARGILTKKPGRSEEMPRYYYFLSELSFFGRGARFFNWFRKLRQSTLENRICTIIKQDKITHVIGVYPNEYYLQAACKAALRMKVKFSSYFHNTYVENAAIKNPNAKKIQQEVFDNSNNIFVMSEGMKSFYQEKYALDKFVPLVHTFQKFPPKPEARSLSLKDKKHIRLVMIGNFNQSNLDATKRFLKAIKLEKKYTMDVYTHVPNVILAKRGFDTTQFINKGMVPANEVLERLQAYDICVLTHGFDGAYGEIEYRTIFPTRTIPFLLSGKPILAHSPNGSFLNKFLSEKGCAELVDDPEEASIRQGLEHICYDQDFHKEIVNNAIKAAGQFYGPKVAKKLVSTLS